MDKKEVKQTYSMRLTKREHLILSRIGHGSITRGVQAMLKQFESNPEDIKELGKVELLRDSAAQIHLKMLKEATEYLLKLTKEEQEGK